MAHKLKAYKTLWYLDYSTESAYYVQYSTVQSTAEANDIIVHRVHGMNTVCGPLKTLLYSSSSSISIYELKIVQHSTVCTL